MPRVTAMGSLFLRHSDGVIYFLNTTDGTFERVADSEDAIDGLPNSSEHRFNLFLGFLVRDLRSKGMVLGPGQCYGWKVPLCLGGEPDAANVEVSDVAVHVSMHGQVHEQVRGMRDGTRIDGVQVIAPEPPPRSQE